MIHQFKKYYLYLYLYVLFIRISSLIMKASEHLLQLVTIAIYIMIVQITNILSFLAFRSSVLR